jgi:hypothetical protein
MLQGRSGSFPRQYLHLAYDYMRHNMRGPCGLYGMLHGITICCWHLNAHVGRNTIPPLGRDGTVLSSAAVDGSSMPWRLRAQAPLKAFNSDSSRTSVYHSCMHGRRCLSPRCTSCSSRTQNAAYPASNKIQRTDLSAGFVQRRLCRVLQG